MRNDIRTIITSVALLLTTSVWANGVFTYKKLLNGSSTTSSTGDVSGAISNGKATLTVTPANGNYITAANITVYRLIGGNNANVRTRTPGIDDTPVAITATNASADPSGTTTYTFDVTDAKFDYEVTADFQSRTDISTVTVTPAQTSYTYTGSAIEPAVTVTLGQATLTKNTDYTVAYSNNVNAGTATITVTGVRKYKGEATKNFAINKATPTVSFSKAAYNGEVGLSFQAPTATTSPNGLTVTYASSKTDVATVNGSTGAVTIVDEGQTTITATFAGNANYVAASASYTLTVVDNAEKYGLWIGGKQVTARNCSDVFGDGNANQKVPASFTYNPDNKHLIVSSTAGLNIETNISEGLVVFLAPKIESKVGSIVYTGTGNAPLTFTTDGNNPGKMTLDNTSSNKAVISGFNELRLDDQQNVVIISPEELSYKDKQLNTATAIIGVPLSPTKEIKPNGEKIEGGESQEDINKVVDDVLYTLKDVKNPNGDGFDDEENCLVINSITSDEVATIVARDYIPSTTDFFELLKGVTFMVPAGRGDVSITIQTKSGYALKVKIGDAEPLVLERPEKSEVVVPYNVGKPTYVYIYAGTTTAKARGIHKGGKKTLAGTKIYGTSIKPSTVKASNPTNIASGGEYTGETYEDNQVVMSDEDNKAAMGDVDGNGLKDAKDVVEMVKAIMGRHSGEFDATFADMNDDKNLDISDIIMIINRF